MKKNIFSKAIKQLKSTEVDDRIQKLDESSPTNSISGLYSLNEPGQRLSSPDPARVFYPDADGNWPDGIPGTPGETKYIRPAGYWDEGPGTSPAKDWDVFYDGDFSYATQVENPRNTDTIIDPNSGFVKSELPPNSRSFILGPIVDSYLHDHGYDNITRVGYIQKDTREFVLLGYIEGTWGDDNNGNKIRADGYEQGNSARVWNGQESSFTAVNNNFTWEMLQWFHNKLKIGAYTQNVAYFLSGGVGCCVGCGGPDQPPGAVGGNGPGGPPPPGGPGNVGSGPGAGGGPPGGPPPFGGPPDQSPPPTEGNPQNPPKKGGPNESGFPWGEDGKPRKRRKPGDPGYDPDIDGDDSNWTKTGDPRGEDGEPITEPDPEKSFDPPSKSDQMNALNKLGGAMKDAAYKILGKTNDLGIAGKTFFDYLTNNTPKKIDNNYLGDRYVRDYLKGAEIVPNDKGEFVFSGPDNVIATSSRPTYNEKTGQVKIPFNYDFEHNNVELDKRNANAFQRAVLNVLGPYSADAQPNSPILPLNSAAGAGLGALIALAKELGGGKHTPGEVTVSIEQLRKYNPDAAATIERFNKLPTQKESVAPDRRKQILREVKKPYVLPEAATPKPMKMNFKGKFSAQNMPSVTASKQSDDLVRSKNAAGQTWRTKDKYWGGYESTERMNVVYDRAGHGDLAFNMVVNENQKAKNMQERKLQEHLNTLAHDAAMRKLDSSYQSPFRNTQTEEQQPVEEPKEPKAEVVKKITKKLKGGDYEGKPAKKDYPNDPPQKQINGYHPDLVTGQKVASRFNRLDPVSARATPKTAYPAIDKKVEKAKKEPK